MDIGEVVARSTTHLAPVAPQRPTTLRELLDSLGPHALRLVTATQDQLSRGVGETALYGPGEPVQATPGGVVLLTGGRSHPAEVLEGIGQAGAAGACAVVVKSWSRDLGTLASAARSAGVALLCTPDEMAWRHLDAFVAAATLSQPPAPEDAGSGDLFGLANAIAASVGGPVTIEEVDGRILAYSNLPDQEIDEIRRRAILGRRTPERPSNAAEYQAVVSSPGAVLFESSHPEYADRLAVAVRAGHRVLGVIFALADRPRLVPDADRALVDAARTVALHLLRLRGSRSPERERRSEALRGLLGSSLDPASAAASLALPERARFALAVVRPTSSAHTRAADAARAADLVSLHGEYWHPESATVLDGGDVVLLLPVLEPGTEPEGGERTRARLRRLGLDLVAAARRSAAVDLVVGFGPMVPDLAAVPGGRLLAGRVAAVLCDPLGPDTQRVATLHDVRSEVVLAALRSGSPVDDDALLLPQVRAVLEHDRTQGTDYARTVLAYLGSLGNVTATAEALGVHDNTTRYRVRRVAERFGVSVDAGDETLVTWLQLRTALGAAPR
ncbi:helix-turn-helix domain-containing protein [Phycicoccus endophyticus]|uniref:Helix-turn-helix domain-containing protein n=1 Tax=Phycicoccus endophyticus TaxID=1690220 RepID=A0A7G9QZP1_9MICO|nr:helix-turn-helix domain-containing protein [Phycicoccus endophyticus]NHI20008.1 PucR family transcriptional regulator [Phycicoccus endophyticus]QNN48816.1 helix-turn-helix domain-containing protein [Phycicoccus endophyticus]GGL42646.1 transcriptional regulator [Phycicoccus endophyticus]